MKTPRPRRGRNLLLSIRRWFDSAAGAPIPHPAGAKRVDWMRCIPFAALHLCCLPAIWIAPTRGALSAAALLYAARMFAITGFYHRYFSHRAFRTSRFWQFVFAVLGNSAAQRGPLWWAAHHRSHHRHSDTDSDVHSAARHGFLWSHMGWFTSRENFATRTELVKDLARYPELRFLDRFDALVPALLAGGLFAAGGLPWLVWGFFVSTVLLFHATCTINSLAHRIGRRRFETGDESRNSALLAILTFGEGWHNNHHHYPASARQGFRWWEIDLTYYGLRLLSWLRIVRDLRPVPPGARAAGP